MDWYQEELAKVDKKMLNTFNSSYEILHLLMGYDGSLNVKSSLIGLEEAEKIIKWVETRQELVSN